MRLALLFFVFALSACGETKAVSGNEVVETTADGEGGDTSGSGDTIDVDEDTGASLESLDGKWESGVFKDGISDGGKEIRRNFRGWGFEWPV